MDLDSNEEMKQQVIQHSSWRMTERRLRKIKTNLTKND